MLFSSVCRFAVRSFPGDIEFLGIRVRGARDPTPWLSASCCPEYDQQGQVFWIFPEGQKSECLYESLQFLNRPNKLLTGLIWSVHCLLENPSLTRNSQGK